MEATKQMTRPLFRSIGVRCLKAPNVNGAVWPNQDKYLIQPASDYPGRLQRVKEFLDPMGLSAAQFEDLSEGLLAKLLADQQLALAASGICLPVPFGARQFVDYGTELKKVLFGVGNAYEAEFPGRKFTHYRTKGDLDNEVKVLPNTRHNRFLACLADGPLVALYFPNLLTWFSVEAQRQQIACLPESMLLCGALDTAHAIAAYPDVLARDSNAPSLDCSAVQWWMDKFSLTFTPRDDGLGFGYTQYLEQIHYSSAGGLLYVG